jgi:hypothetical protein
MLVVERTPLTSTDWKFKPAFVGYADILGFGKKITDRTQRGAIVEAYKEIRRNVLDRENWLFPNYFTVSHGFGEQAGKPVFNVVLAQDHLYMVSDSIFFILVPEKPSELECTEYALASLRIMSRILTICWKYELPARGAVSDGDVLYDSVAGTFIGEAIVKAVSWEKTQAFSWFSVEPSSWMRTVTARVPTHQISRTSQEVPISENYFCTDRVKKFQNRWHYSVEKTLTVLPDFSYDPAIAESKGLEASFLFLSPRRFLTLLGDYRNSSSADYRRFWNNTESLFLKLGVTEDFSTLGS